MLCPHIVNNLKRKEQIARIAKFFENNFELYHKSIADSIKKVNSIYFITIVTELPTDNISCALQGNHDFRCCQSERN